MLDKLRGMFNKGEEARRMALKPDEKDEVRTIKNPNLETWMKETGEEGEMHGTTQEFIAADFHEKPTSKLEIIQGGKTEEEVMVEPVVEKADQRQVELDQMVAQAQAQLHAAKEELKRAQAEKAAYEGAKEKVREAA
ncbi:MAG: hypothetical protein NT034_02140 [Candidatus Magasanikbacteria bacterium]|nr:hypothetical protein [Candidatus Magasanikbacteria bacterium]